MAPSCSFLPSDLTVFHNPPANLCCCYQISCLWESGPRHYAAAAGLLRDSVPFMKATSTPIEAYVINMAAQLNATDR